MKVVKVADDLTGRELDSDSPSVEVKISIDGKDIVLDLTPQSAEAIKALGTEAAPKLFAGIFRAEAPKTRTTKTAKTPAGDTTKIREWAKANGFPDIKDRGSISKDVREKYDAAH
jgi:Lsr2